MKRLAAVLILGALASGCVTTRAQAPIERPALEVPPAPPRVVEPAPVPEVVQPEPVGELPPPPVTPSPPVNRAPRGSNAQRETQKPEPKPDPAAAPVEPVLPPPTPPPATQPASLLRTPATADAATAERLIRETIQRAQGILNKVNYQALSGDRQKEYQNVKDQLMLADAALKESNLDLAKGLASTAEKLATELRGR